MYDEAKRKREEAAYREQAWTTGMLAGNFQSVINELEVLKNRGIKQLPWFEIEHGQLVTAGAAPAQDAFNKVVGLAAHFEEGKAEEYYRLAQDELARSPRSAYKRIKDDILGSFKYLGDHWRRTLEDFLKDTVEPTVKQREELNRALADAPKATKNPNPRKAWQETCELALQDPYAENIESAKQIARMRAGPAFNADLTSAEDLLRAGEYDTAMNRAQMVRDLTWGDEPFSETNTRATQMVERAIEAKSVNAEVARIDLLVEANVAQAAQDLTELKHRLGKRVAEFPEVKRLEQIPR